MKSVYYDFEGCIIRWLSHRKHNVFVQRHSMKHSWNDLWLRSMYLVHMFPGTRNTCLRHHNIFIIPRIIPINRQTVITSGAVGYTFKTWKRSIEQMTLWHHTGNLLLKPNIFPSLFRILKYRLDVVLLKGDDTVAVPHNHGYSVLGSCNTSL